MTQNKEVDWKKAKIKLKSKLENIMEHLNLATHDYKELWFEYLIKLFHALDLKREYVSNPDALKEFVKIYDSVLDVIVNGIIYSFSMKEIQENIKGKYSKMPQVLMKKLLLKLMEHYSYEKKVFTGFTELLTDDYAELISRCSKCLVIKLIN